MKPCKLATAVYAVLLFSGSYVSSAPVQGTYDDWLRARGLQKPTEDRSALEADLLSLNSVQPVTLFPRKRLSGLERRTYSQFLTVAVQRQVWPSSWQQRVLITGEEKFV